jgi:hypothetical protein
MNKFQIPVACPESWDDMTGDDKIRHCWVCRQSVYNFAQMTQEEINTLMATKMPLCARIYRRPDGTVITKDCQAPRPDYQFPELRGRIVYRDE